MQRVARLGWVVQPNGSFRDAVDSFDIFTTHIDDIKHRISRSWGWIFTAEISHRKDFGGVQHVDLAATMNLLREFSATDQVYLRCSLDGTLFTQKDKKHFQEGNLGLCEFCGVADSPEHRVWRCPQFVDQREAFPKKFLPVLSDLPPCTLQHAWAFRPESYNQVAKALNQFEDVQTDAYRLPDLPVDSLDLFCDGTCRFPESKPLRIAAWAVTLASAGSNAFQNELVAAGWVPGHHQSAFRAELLGFSTCIDDRS